ncbi:hypothetical protein P5E74_14305, partial [Clostridium perfringens]|nr:hypothetical protein [Clostridium perfringens]
MPSKTLSYMCAGRPILGLMPSDNQAAVLLAASGNCVLAPERASLPAAARWVRAVLGDGAIAQTLGMDARALAEHQFALEGCADEFE